MYTRYIIDILISKLIVSNIFQPWIIIRLRTIQKWRLKWKKYPYFSRDFFPLANIYIYIYIFQDFCNVCAGINGNRNSPPSRERKEVNTGSVKSRGSTVQVNLGYGPNTFEDSRRASSSVSQVWRVCISSSFARHPIFVAREKKKKKQNIREERTRKNWIKRDFPPRARYHLLKALKNPPLRKISLVQRGYNSSQSILQQFVKIHVRYSSSKQFLFFFNFY